MVEQRKLTKAMLRVLESVASNRGAAHTVYALGRGTCEALRKRGLVKGEKPFDRLGGNPYVYITDAGRAALNQEDSNAGR